MPKLHKKVPKDHLIQAAANAVTTLASKTSLVGLNMIKHEMKIESNINKQKIGVNWFISIETSLEVITKLRELNNKGITFHETKTMDIAGFFEQLPHNELLLELRKVCKRIVKQRRTNYLLINQKTGIEKWISKGNITTWFGYKIYSLWDICNIIEQKILHQYIQIGDTILRKKKGIDMGANDSPLLVDIFAICSERKFFLSTNSHIQLSLKYITRKIDDILFINAPYGPKLATLIYPKQWFQLSLEGSKYSTNYLDITVYKDNDNSWSWKPYAKTNNFEFDVVSFPNAFSSISRRYITPTLLGRLIHLSCISKHEQNFISTSKKLVLHLIHNNKWNIKNIRVVVNKFLKLYSSYDNIHILSQKICEI